MHSAVGVADGGAVGGEIAGEVAGEVVGEVAAEVAGKVGRGCSREGGLVIITLHANIALRRPRQVTSSSASCAQVICGRCATDTPTRRAVCLAAS